MNGFTGKNKDNTDKNTKIIEEIGFNSVFVSTRTSPWSRLKQIYRQLYLMLIP
jgi:hypothetical protein